MDQKLPIADQSGENLVLPSVVENESAPKGEAWSEDAVAREEGFNCVATDESQIDAEIKDVDGRSVKESFKEPEGTHGWKADGLKEVLETLPDRNSKALSMVEKAMELFEEPRKEDRLIENQVSPPESLMGSDVKLEGHDGSSSEEGPPRGSDKWLSQMVFCTCMRCKHQICRQRRIALQHVQDYGHFPKEDLHIPKDNAEYEWDASYPSIAPDVRVQSRAFQRAYKNFHEKKKMLKTFPPNKKQRLGTSLIVSDHQYVVNMVQRIIKT